MLFGFGIYTSFSSFFFSSFLSFFIPPYFFSLSSNASNARKQELTGFEHLKCGFPEWKFSTLLELNFLLYIFYFITSFTLLFTMLKIIILTIFKEKTSNKIK